MIRLVKPVAGQGSFPALCVARGWPEPVAEFQFAPPRRWRFDWAFHGFTVLPYHGAEMNIAIEINGGLFIGGRHVSGAALLKEYEKLRYAARLGYRVLIYTPEQFASGDVFADLEAME